MDKLIAGLSTAAIGMIVVFVGLAILIFFLTLMNIISQRAAKKTAIPSSDKVPEPEVAYEEEEAQEDDGALSAVLTAAIAAVWEGAAPEGGFVVRRVRRISNAPAWQRSAREEQMYSRM